MKPSAESSLRRDLPRTVGLWSAAGIMVGVTVGSGIYRTPAEIARYVDAPWQIIAAWLVGGLLSLFGALTYAELAVRFPRSGGLYNFLYQGLGPRVSFIFGWTYMLITKPLAAAGIAIVFAEYVAALAGPGYSAWLVSNVPGAGPLESILGDQWHNVTLVCIVLAVLTYINYLGMRLGSGVNLVLTIIKLLCLASIVFCAFAFANAFPAAPLAVDQTPPAPSARPFMLSLAPLLAAVLWTYDGWSDIGSIAGEVKEPSRNLPRIYILGTMALVVLYVVVNLAYLHVLPLEEMRASKAVASDVMLRAVGPIGASLVTIFVLISTLGATHASVLTGARVTFAQAQDGLLFRVLGRIDERRQTPAIALWSQLFLSCLCAISFQQFNNLASGFVFTMWIFYGLGGIAMLRLRKSLPANASYRCWGFPVIPLLFVLSAAAMTILHILNSFRAPIVPGELSPWLQTCIFLGILAIGWPAYDIWRYLTRSSLPRV